MFCIGDHPFLLIFSAEVEHIIYYTHIPTALVSLILGLFIYFKGGKTLASKILLAVAITFFIWFFFDLVLWADLDSRSVMIFWSFEFFLQIVVSILTLYFAYAFLEKRDASFKTKVAFTILPLSFLLLAPTKLVLTDFDLEICESLINPLFVCYYLVSEAFIFLITIVFLTRKIRFSKGKERHLAIYFSAGLLMFIASFQGSNIAGTLLGNWANWKFLQYAYFGLPIFMAFLIYLVIRYQAFNLKLLSVQVLVIVLASLVATQLFFVRGLSNVMLVIVTLLLVAFFGMTLIRSIKAEVDRREQLQQMANRLALVNNQLRKLDNDKSEFVSFASRQFQAPLSVIKGFISLLLEGSYGQASLKHRDVFNKIYFSNEKMIHMVEEMFNSSRIESGRMEYVYEKVNIVDVCKEVVDILSLRAKEKNLNIAIKYPERSLPEVIADRSKIGEVISNIVDNAIKYTLDGGVTIGFSEEVDFVKVSIKDTGIGIPAGETPYLFAKFSRGKDLSRLNTGGLGLGLSIGRSMMQAMGGKITFESEGKGKGTTFMIYIPTRIKPFQEGQSSSVF